MCCDRVNVIPPICLYFSKKLTTDDDTYHLLSPVKQKQFYNLIHLCNDDTIDTST